MTDEGMIEEEKWEMYDLDYHQVYMPVSIFQAEYRKDSQFLGVLS